MITEPDTAMSTGRLRGKVAPVTGAPRSMVRAIAHALADDGARVVVPYRSRRDEAEATVAALRERGAEVIAIGRDLSDSASVVALFAQTQAALGGIDIVVANAGVTTALSPVADISDEDFDPLLSSNTRATFYVLRQAARTVRDDGRIINISSSSMRFAPAFFGGYATSKAGANTTIGVLANEPGPREITANSIMAGPICAGFLDPAGDLVQSAPDAMIEFLTATAPTGRLGRPSDIGAIAAFLAAAGAGWINGQAILANNGGSGDRHAHRERSRRHDLRAPPRGFHVLGGVCTRQDADRLAGENVEPVIVDITDEGQVAALAHRVAQDPQGRRLGAVVNNAGVAVNAPVEAIPLAEWRRHFEVNFFGHVAVVQALLPALIAGGDDRRHRPRHPRRRRRPRRLHLRAPQFLIETASSMGFKEIYVSPRSRSSAHP